MFVSSLGPDERLSKWELSVRAAWPGSKNNNDMALDLVCGDKSTLCDAIVLPGRKSVFRAGCRPDSNRKSFKIGPPAGRRPAPIVKLSRLESGRNPARKPDFWPGSTIA